MTNPDIELAPDVKSFRGSYVLYRQRGKGMEPTRPPRFRRQTRAAAETEATRLLECYPKATFLIVQEVGRLKLKTPADIDAFTGCADDQTFAAWSSDALRNAANRIGVSEKGVITMDAPGGPQEATSSEKGVE